MSAAELGVKGALGRSARAAFRTVAHTLALARENKKLLESELMGYAVNGRVYRR